MASQLCSSDLIYLSVIISSFVVLKLCYIDHSFPAVRSSLPTPTSWVTLRSRLVCSASASCRGQLTHKVLRMLCGSNREFRSRKHVTIKHLDPYLTLCYSSQAQ